MGLFCWRKWKMNKKVYMIPNPFVPGRVVVIDPDLCNGCNACVEVCAPQVIMPTPGKKNPPVLLYPDECWFCGACVMHCTSPGSITLEHPLNQRVGWKRKETGEYFRIGMQNPPPPNTKPPIG
jgi:NAD-dependent dihydropyrimidine dehydrogenase PreA subunit